MIAIRLKDEKEKIMAKFVLLLKGGDFTEYSPEDMQKIVEKYVNWSQVLRDKNQHIAGEELSNNGRVVTVNNGKVVDGPFAETKETVGGFWLIEAENLEQAVQISRSCPHLDFKGEVEVREVIPH
jgi:hypothetical protein